MTCQADSTCKNRCVVAPIRHSPKQIVPLARIYDCISTPKFAPTNGRDYMLYTAGAATGGDCRANRLPRPSWLGTNLAPTTLAE